MAQNESVVTASKLFSTPQGIALNIQPAWEVHPQDVQEALKDGEELLILDVRRPAEWNTTHIEHAKLIPLNELEARIDELAAWKNKRVVVHCHHGVRSLNATILLRKKGFTNVHSLAGGIEAWSLLVDTNVARY